MTLAILIPASINAGAYLILSLSHDDPGDQCFSRTSTFQSHGHVLDDTESPIVHNRAFQFVLEHQHSYGIRANGVPRLRICTGRSLPIPNKIIERYSSS